MNAVLEDDTATLPEARRTSTIKAEIASRILACERQRDVISKHLAASSCVEGLCADRRESWENQETALGGLKEFADGWFARANHHLYPSVCRRIEAIFFRAAGYGVAVELLAVKIHKQIAALLEPLSSSSLFAGMPQTIVPEICPGTGSNDLYR